MALLLCISMLALLIALTSEFTYETSIHAMQAANARDEVRAHYLARSAVSISRLLIKIQQRFVEPIMRQAQQMLSQATRRRHGGQPAPDRLRRADHGLLRRVGGRGEDAGRPDRADSGRGQGPGAQVRPHGRGDQHRGRQDRHQLRQRADRDPQPADHRVPAAVGAVLLAPLQQPVHPRPTPTGSSSSAPSWPGRSSTGPTATSRASASRRAAGGSEDYRYDAGRDPYRAHDNSYDTVEEVGLVRGMDARMLEAFLPYLTVYASDRARTAG